ncbi:MAG: methyltransferase domain-containing protein [bacterium]
MTRDSLSDFIDKKHYSYTAYEEDSVTQQFDTARFSGFFGEYIAEHQENFLLQQIGSPAGLRILDIGAGTGRISLPLSRMDAQVHAADASLKMLQILQQKAFLQGVCIPLSRIDAHALPFTDQSFDVVMSFRLIMHVVDWKRVVAEICRVSRDYVILDFPPLSGFAGLAPLIHPFIRLVREHHQSYRVFRIGEVVSALHSENFETTAIDKHLVLPFGLHRFLNSPGFTRLTESFLQKIGFRDMFGAPVTLVARRKGDST